MHYLNSTFLPGIARKTNFLYTFFAKLFLSGLILQKGLG